MTLYRIHDSLVDTEMARNSWNEDTEFDGHNHLSKNTGSQWNHERLHRSSKGRFYIEHYSQQPGAKNSAEWVTDREAVVWLLLNGHDSPKDLEELAKELRE